MIPSPLRAVAAAVLAAALAVSGCSVFGGESTREFCVVADDIVEIGSVDDFTAFATLVNFGSTEPSFADDVKFALDAAVTELNQLAALMEEAARATTDADAAAAFRHVADAYSQIATAADEEYSGVTDTASVSEATFAFQDRIASVAQDDQLDEAAFTVDDTMFDQCGVTLSGSNADPGLDRAAGNAMVDASTLGREIAIYWVDGAELPSVAMEGDKWLVGGEVVAVVSDNIELADYSGTTSSDWCVQVVETETDITYSYSAQRGLTEIPCAEQSG